MLLTLLQLNFRSVYLPAARVVAYPSVVSSVAAAPTVARAVYPAVVATVQAPKA
jgi:hypothetical protein